MQTQNKILLCVLILFLYSSFLLTGCQNKEKKSGAQKTTIIEAKLQTPVERLYFVGTLAPISTVAVVSPAAGNIETMFFTYGEKVKKNDKLFVLNSQSLSEEYRKVVSDFLQKKQSYTTNTVSFTGAQALYGAGVISESDYASAKSQYDTSMLDYLQSQFQLEKVLSAADVDIKQIESLTISDTKKVNTILQRHFRHMEITAPGPGVALFPTGESSNDESSKRMEVGTIVKEGQLLLSIGNLSGLSATFNVSEIDIGRMHRGIPVIVTGDAFPGLRLEGIITAVSAQANQDHNHSGVSMFSIKMNIPKITEKEMGLIRVGMTAKFEIDIQSKPRIMLPIKAVFPIGKENAVIVVDANGHQKTVPVITGNTTPTKIVIISGIKVGDKVLVHD